MNSLCPVVAHLAARAGYVGSWGTTGGQQSEGRWTACDPNLISQAIVR